MKTRKSNKESLFSSRVNEVKNRILNIFTKSPSISIRFNHIFNKLKISKHEKALLRDTLRDLVIENILIKRGKYYEFAARTAFYEGKVILDEDLGYAIEARIDNLIERIQVKKRNLQTALLGDTVQFTILEYAENEIKEAIVEKIINRTKHKIIGVIQFSSGSKENAYILPDDKKFRKEIYVPPGNLKNAKHGDKAICEIVNWEYQDLPPEGKIIEVLGKAGEVETELRSLLKKYGLNKNFPKNVKEELKVNLENDKFRITPVEISRRLDVRNKIVFTIDPADAKDFDDAVQIEKTKNGNYLLGVHIADVSFYVREGTKTDEEANSRGTSVYLMNDVVPMLPEKLSNDLCSLKEGKDRLTFSVFMEINQSGDVLNFNLNKSIINSSKRFSYMEVQKIIDEQKGSFLNEVNLMNELHKILFKRRLRDGSLDFETQEVTTELDDDGNIKNIKPKEHLESMRMIEDFMLLANKCVALFIERKDPRPPFIYRIHDIPDKKKMKELSHFVKQFGISLNPDNKHSIQQMLEHVRGKEEEYLINELTIRSMSKAVYSEENIGHYGLGFKFYTHFTSPIRRYPDLVVHRILSEVLKKNSSKKIKNYGEILPEICRHSTDMEINAVQCEREAIKIMQIQFLEKHVGDIFSGIISGITEYGLYVEISSNLIEGMVRLRDLKDDYYILDEKNYRLIGKTRRKTYRVGDRVQIKVSRLDKGKKWIDFQIV